MSDEGFEEYLASIGRVSVHVDPLVATPEAERIRHAADSLTKMDTITIESLTAWLEQHPREVEALTLAVGLTHERTLRNLQAHFGTAGMLTLAKTRPRTLIEWLDTDFDLVRSLKVQLDHEHTFGDILVARAGSRARAKDAGAQGRSVEDQIEAIAKDLGLKTMVRTRFTGRGGEDAPCDLLITDEAGRHHIAVAAKGFDSTGSKLSDAVREIADMATVRLPSQFIFAVVDGIGWHARLSDLRRIYDMRATNRIDGLYTVATLQDLRNDLIAASRRLDLLDIE